MVIKPITVTPSLIEDEMKDNLPGSLHSYSITNSPELTRFKHLSFKKSVEYIDFEKTFNHLDKNLNDWNWFMTDGDGYHFHHKDDISKIMITHEGCHTFLKEEDIIIGDEIGYQRKGANTRFYAEDEYAEGLSMWDSPPVVSENTLVMHWNKYFSGRTPEVTGGFGAGVEYNQADSEMRENFKNNIIDKFVEGETFVIYC